MNEWPREFPEKWPVRRKIGGSVPWYLAGGAPTPVGAYQAVGAGSLAESYINLANPGTKDLTLGAAGVSLVANGWQSNGTGYLRTGIVPVKSGTSLCRFENSNTAIAQGIYGLYESATVAYLLRPTAAAMQVYCSNTVSNFPVVADAVYGFANGAPYKNGVAEATAATPNGDPTVEIYLLRYNQGGPAGSFDGQMQAFVYWDEILDADQILAVSTAMAAL